MNKCLWNVGGSYKVSCHELPGSLAWRKHMPRAGYTASCNQLTVLVYWHVDSFLIYFIQLDDPYIKPTSQISSRYQTNQPGIIQVSDQLARYHLDIKPTGQISSRYLTNLAGFIPYMDLTCQMYHILFNPARFDIGMAFTLLDIILIYVLSCQMNQIRIHLAI